MKDPSLRVVGHQWARDAHAIKDFLGRNQVAFRWLDLDRTRQAGVILEREGLSGAALPVVLLPDGTVLEDPSLEALAEHLGMHMHAERTYYDVAIVGAGPAGLAAAVYGASEGLSTVLIEGEAPGGQAGTSSRIENYLGFPTGVSGGPTEAGHHALAEHGDDAAPRLLHLVANLVDELGEVCFEQLDVHWTTVLLANIELERHQRHLAPLLAWL